MLVIEGLTKHYNGDPVVVDFNLTVPENGFTALIGPSGCGKSTLFDLLMGAQSTDSGRICWHEAVVPDLSTLAAYMQQSDLLLPWLGLMDNACLPADIAAEPAVHSRQRAEALFERLGLAGYGAHLPSMVSGGMRQRCALARTLMFGRDLVLLDEPLSALDAITRRRLQQMLRLLKTDFGKTILMVTHDIDEALLLADEILVLTPLPMQTAARIVLDMPPPRRIEDSRLTDVKHQVLALLEEDSRP